MPELRHPSASMTVPATVGAPCWQVTGRSPPLGSNWRSALAQRLSERPRRLGLWAELALAGARACLDAAGEDQLPCGTLLQVGSLVGPASTVKLALTALQTGIEPMPYTFLQSQQAVMLAALASHLGWVGNAVLLNHRDPLAQLRLALLASAASPQGVLIGWVEEAPQPHSQWLRLRPIPQEAVTTHWRELRIEDLSTSHGGSLSIMEGALWIA